MLQIKCAADVLYKKPPTHRYSLEHKIRTNILLKKVLENVFCVGLICVQQVAVTEHELAALALDHDGRIQDGDKVIISPPSQISYIRTFLAFFSRLRSFFGGGD